MALACLIAFGSPAHAVDWQTLSGSNQYTATINGSKYFDNATINAPLTQSGAFGMVELYYYGIGKPGANPGSENLTIQSGTSDSTITINFDNHATSGVYIARRNHNFVVEGLTDEDILNPVLTINSNLLIDHNFSSHTNITDSGLALAGITIANGSLKINGNNKIDSKYDLKIRLLNMTAPQFDSSGPSRIDYNNSQFFDWDLVYGWSSLDELNASDSASSQPHDLKYLQAGIASGFSNIDITGNSLIQISGQNGLLTGWYWAPNTRTSGKDINLKQLANKATIGGSLEIDVTQSQAGYGVFGLLWENSESSSVSPISAEIGELIVNVKASNFSIPETKPEKAEDINSGQSYFAENSYKLLDYTNTVAGIYANKNINISAKNGITSQATVSQQSTLDNIYGTFLQSKSNISKTSGINTQATITNGLTTQKTHAIADGDVIGLYLNDRSSVSETSQIVSNANAIGNITAAKLYGTFLQNNSNISGVSEIYTKATINNNLVKPADQVDEDVPPAEANEISGLYINNNSSISATNQIVSEVEAADLVIVDNIYGTFIKDNSNINVNTGSFSTAVTISAGDSFEATVTKVDGLHVDQNSRITATDGISSKIQVQGNSTVGNIYGIYLNDQSKLETPEIISTVEIDENAKVTNIVGLSIAGVTNTSLDSASVVIAGTAENIYGVNLSNSALSVSDNLTINVGQPSNNLSRPIALRMQGNSDFVVNEANQGQVSLTGDIVATATDNVNIAFGTGGTFTGAANIADGTDASSGLSLDFSAGGSWSVNGNSAVTQLTLGNGSIVDLGLYDYTQNTTADALGFGSSTLDIHSFVSLRDSPGVFLFHLDNQQGTQQSGLVSLVGEVDPTNNFAEIMLTDDGSGFSAEKTNYLIRQASSVDNDAEFALVDQPGVGRQTQLGVYLYELKSIVDGSGDTYWYAEKTGTVAPPIEDTVSMASYSTQITHYLARLSDLRQRLGDVRYYGSNGLWTTVKTSNEHLTGLASSSFEIDTYGINVGWDGTDQNGWTYGLYGRYFTSDQKAKQPYHYTNGESESWGLSLYLSRAFENNAYIDLVASYDHFDQELKGQLSDGMTRFKTDYNTHGYGVSAEAGFQHALTDDGLFLLEPSVQLSYYRVEGQDFKLTKGISVSESSVDSLTGRAGVNLVRKFMRNGEKVGEFYAKAGVNYEFMGEQSISANEAKYEGDLLGLRLYYGLGASMKLRPDLYGWIQFAREEGDDYTKEYEGTAGIRWVF